MKVVKQLASPYRMNMNIIKAQQIHYSEITDIKSSQIDNIRYAIYKQSCCNEVDVMLLSVGSIEECTPTYMSEFARIYSLPTHMYKNDDYQFRRYFYWLSFRNKLIKGFTEYDDNYYMVADRLFFHCYSRYGFCSACGILRCSPVWCICGHKELSNGWTSNNKQLDEFIKKSQLQTTSPNDVYLEWIPFDCTKGIYLKDLPVTDYELKVKLIPLEITDETDDSYYAEVSYLLIRHVC